MIMAHPRRRRAGGLRRQDPGRHGLPRPQKMQARDLSPLDVMKALDNYNVFLPTGDAKFGDTRLRPRFQLDVRAGQAEWATSRCTLELGNVVYLEDVATPKDASYIQTNVVRVNGKRRGVHPRLPPARRQHADRRRQLSRRLAQGHRRAAHPHRDRPEAGHGPVGLRPAVRSKAWFRRGCSGAVLCSLVILMFLGEWRMTMIAIMTLPISVTGRALRLYFTGQTINVMTLAGLTLAIGPMIDSAIICLENTHRHLGLGATPRRGGLPRGQRGRHARTGLDALHVPGARARWRSCRAWGNSCFMPMTLAVAFAMIAAYILSRTLVPTCSALAQGSRRQATPSGEHGAWKSRPCRPPRKSRAPRAR